MPPDKSINRRVFLGTAAGAAVCATGLGSAAAALAARAGPVPTLLDLTSAQAAALIGTPLQITGSTYLQTQQEAELVLDSVTAHEQAGGAAPVSSGTQRLLSLVFRVRSDVELADGTHCVSGTSLATCDLFLNELRFERDRTHKYYEAVLG